MGDTDEELKARRTKFILAVSLTAAGLLINATLFVSWASRYFWVENSGVEESSADFRHLISMTPAEQALSAFGALVIALGLVVFFWRTTNLRLPGDRRQG